MATFYQDLFSVPNALYPVDLGWLNRSTLEATDRAFKIHTIRHGVLRTPYFVRYLLGRHSAAGFTHTGNSHIRITEYVRTEYSVRITEVRNAMQLTPEMWKACILPSFSCSPLNPSHYTE